MTTLTPRAQIWAWLASKPASTPTPFGTYMHEWEARDVAQSLRRKGHHVQIRRAHAYHWTVALSGPVWPTATR